MDLPDALVKLTIHKFKKKYTYDFAYRTQEDHQKFQHYNRLLQNKQIFNLKAEEFSKFLNCTFDYLVCEKNIKEITQYLLIESYLTEKVPSKRDLKDLLFSIDEISQYLRIQEKFNKNPSHYPLVSLIMASHDRDYFLLEAVKSCFYLTYPNWELYIVDDGSSNPLTYKVLELLESIPKLIVQYLYTNQYCSFTNNYAIAQLQGEYFALLVDDDIMVPDRIEKQLNFMQNNPEIDFSGGQAITIDASGKITLIPDRPFINIWHIIISMVGNNHFPHSSLFVRMNDKMKKHFYYENTSAPDFRLWFKLLIDLEQERIRIGMTQAHVIIQREHGKRMTYTENAAFLHIQKWTAIKQVEAYNTFSPLLLEQVHSQCLRTALHDISNKNHIVRACKDFDMAMIAKLMLAHQQTKDFYSPKDIQELNETLQFYTDYYNQAVLQRRVNLQPEEYRKVFASILSVGDSISAEKQIESLKDFVDGIAVVHINTDLQYDGQNSQNKNSSYLRLKYQDSQKIKVEYMENDSYRIVMEKFNQQLRRFRVGGADYILILGPGEFVSPKEIKRFQNYRMDIGIFGLQQQNQSKLITSSKITTHWLLNHIGYEQLRKYEIDPDIFKLANEHAFEDNIYLIQVDFGMLNVQTIKNGGYYIQY
ncbi:UNKNOWN [Stylonychia lemnae]|uniref:Glycosyltransferase 2-like domain-containing protein n=1 Tax=Stylonychia lemnae TaxID=5949 RepID=A0A078AD84_STYLE|nr:UNKNOWN [Stylonychia lemnae]|eukprot:CDW79492.1 UNKNOWN [Stylonychia lemnae]